MQLFLPLYFLTRETTLLYLKTMQIMQPYWISKALLTEDFFNLLIFFVSHYAAVL